MKKIIRQRLAIATILIAQMLATPLSAQTSYPEDGWWWDADASGRGYFIERQKDYIFVAAFVYADDGSPEWLTASGGYLAAAEYPDGIYHYHVTSVEPYILGCFKGSPGTVSQ